MSIECSPDSIVTVIDEHKRWHDEQLFNSSQCQNIQEEGRKPKDQLSISRSLRLLMMLIIFCCWWWTSKKRLHCSKFIVWFNDGIILKKHKLQKCIFQDTDFSTYNYLAWDFQEILNCVHFVSIFIVYVFLVRTDEW